MDMYIARQPIFDKYMNIYGYELLYRKSSNNFYEGTDDDKATAELLNNAFLTMEIKELTCNTKAFINFSDTMLMKEIPYLLPKDEIVIEILERVKVTPDIIENCRELKNRGYLLALDDFVFDETFLPLIELADIIKVEFTSNTEKELMNLINEYGHQVKFLAEKVETREDYQLAVSMGFNYFQGYFFSKPVMIKRKEININLNLAQIMNVLNRNNPDYQKITEIIERDIGLTFKLLKLANSTYFQSMNKIHSIKQALIRVGLTELKKWVYLMMLKEVQFIENKELIKNSLLRGKICDLIAYEVGLSHKHLELFIAGLFSSINILLNRDMNEILVELPFDADVKDALIGKKNQLRDVLDYVINCELANWDILENNNYFFKLTCEDYMRLYMESLKWVEEQD